VLVQVTVGVLVIVGVKVMVEVLVIVAVLPVGVSGDDRLSDFLSLSHRWWQKDVWMQKWG
jgi:hypothetical protein